MKREVDYKKAWKKVREYLRGYPAMSQGQEDAIQDTRNEMDEILKQCTKREKDEKKNVA